MYKVFIQREITGAEYAAMFGIVDIGFFTRNDIPELSEIRVLLSRINLMFEYLSNPQKQAIN